MSTYRQKEGYMKAAIPETEKTAAILPWPSAIFIGADVARRTTQGIEALTPDMTEAEKMLIDDVVSYGSELLLKGLAEAGILKSAVTGRDAERLSLAMQNILQQNPHMQNTGGLNSHA